MIRLVEDTINKIGSLFFFSAANAAKAIAGAVFLPKGSRIILSGITFNALICSATINLCSSLQINIQLFIFSSFSNLSWVFWSSDLLLSETNGKYCFGKLLLESGQSLVPVPPHKITGNISFLIIF